MVVRTQTIDQAREVTPAATIRVPILAYHDVRPLDGVPSAKRGLVVDVKSFKHQMRLLRDLGYRSITLNDLTQALQGARTLEPKALIVTFDDGYAGVYQHAFPILNDYGFSATLFLIAEDFDTPRATTQRAFPVLSHAQVMEMLGAGFEVGSHSFSHPRLAECADQQIPHELFYSRRVLEDAFGISTTAFCFPYGSHDERVQAALPAAGYHSACSTRFGRDHHRANLYELSRIPVGAAQRLPQFIRRFFWERGQ
jgi:peptidoglycan/xylan/chitin deacetylase (PgdA/CDA1 family)